MTLVAAWVQTFQNSDLLVVASDSRLRGGVRFDNGPKLFPLARGDAVLAFAGDTYFAYPLIHHVLHYLDTWDPARDRSIGLGRLAGHMARMFEDMLSEADFGGMSPEDLQADFVFLLAGISGGRWRFWRSEVEWKKRTCRFRRVSPLSGAVFIGDAAPAASMALQQLRHKLGVRTKKRPPPVVWEPLDVLRKAIATSNTEGSVGGPIQLVRVFRDLNVAPYAVLWPGADGKERVTLFGRQLLSYEQTRLLAFDPKSHRTYKLWDYLKQPVLKSGGGEIPELDDLEE